MGIVGCVSGCEDSSSVLGDIGVCIFIHCRAHVGIRFIGLHPHSTATGLTCTISDSIYLILGCSDPTCSASDAICIISGSGDVRTTEFSIGFVHFHCLLTTAVTAVIGNIVSCVDVFVFPLPQTHRHRDHSDSSSYSTTTAAPTPALINTNRASLPLPVLYVGIVKDCKYSVVNYMPRK